MVKRIFMVLFIAVSLADLLAIYFSLEWLQHICKPLITVMLGGYYFVSAPREHRSGIIMLALFFSFLGDSFLMYEAMNELYFMSGLGSFLLAHVMFILVYRKFQWIKTDNELAGVHRVRMALPVVLAGCGLLVVLYPKLNELLVPVMIYAAVLVVMVLMALFRYGRTSSLSFSLVFAGALLFMISDSLLAFNKFLQPVFMGGLLVMITYISAQFLIIEGLLNHKENQM